LELDYIVALRGLALFLGRARVLEVDRGINLHPDTWSGLSTSITELGEGSLGVAVLGLAGWMLLALPSSV
jgi:hypothetical protein